jgi:hypothetical protein
MVAQRLERGAMYTEVSQGPSMRLDRWLVLAYPDEQSLQPPWQLLKPLSEHCVISLVS